VNVGIIGCGAWGKKRASNLAGCRLLCASDSDTTKTGMIDIGCTIFYDYREVLNKPVDIVIVSVPIESLSEITIAALRAGKHILVEKPAARNSKEIEAMQIAEKESGKLVRVGFTLRYHRAFRKTFKIIHEIGPIMYVRGRYGHGGRKGYAIEWRLKKEAGELLDQGVHLIDLAQAFLGKFDRIIGEKLNAYWEGASEDNVFMILNVGERVASLHASYTEWKNLFSFEIFGKQGKIEISGLGGSYGVERVTLYKMLPEMGPPETTTWEYPMADDSLECEMADFLNDIQLNRTPKPGLAEAAEVMRVVEGIH
jgi:predicted dehydrogenase